MLQWSGVLSAGQHNPGVGMRRNMEAALHHHEQVQRTFMPYPTTHPHPVLFLPAGKGGGWDVALFEARLGIRKDNPFMEMQEVTLIILMRDSGAGEPWVNNPRGQVTMLGIGTAGGTIPCLSPEPPPPPLTARLIIEFFCTEPLRPQHSIIIQEGGEERGGGYGLRVFCAARRCHAASRRPLAPRARAGFAGARCTHARGTARRGRG